MSEFERSYLTISQYRISKNTVSKYDNEANCQTWDAGLNAKTWDISDIHFKLFNFLYWTYTFDSNSTLAASSIGRNELQLLPNTPIQANPIFKWGLENLLIFFTPAVFLDRSQTIPSSSACSTSNLCTGSSCATQPFQYNILPGFNCWQSKIVKENPPICRCMSYWKRTICMTISGLLGGSSQKLGKCIIQKAPLAAPIVLLKARPGKLGFL